MTTRKLDPTAFLLSVFLLLAVAGEARPDAAQAAETQTAEIQLDLTSYLETLRIERRESWLAGELRELRTYPHLDRAYRLTDRGDLAGAEVEMASYLEIDPADARVRFEYLLLLYRQGNFPSVVEQAARILDTEPGFVPSLLYRGMARQKMADRVPDDPFLDDAAADFESAASADGVDPAARRFALDLLVDLRIRQQRWDDADRALRRLVDDGATGYPVAFRRGLVAQSQGRNDRAWESFRHAAVLAGDDKDPELCRALAEVAIQRRDYTAAESWIREVLARDGRPADRELLAHALSSQGRDAPAAAELESLLDRAEADEDRYRLAMALGYAYARQGRHRQAAGAFRRAREAHDDRAVVEALGEALAGAGEWLEAVRLWQEVVRRSPDAVARYRLGTAYAQSGDEGAALPQLEAAVRGELPPALGLEAQLQLGHLLYRHGSFAAARAAFETAAEDRPDDADLQAALGRTSLELDDFAAARRHLSRALELRDSPETRHALAQAHVGLGETERAIGIYRGLLDSSAERPALLETMANLELGRHNDVAAATLFLEILELEPVPPSVLLEKAAESLVLAERYEDALRMSRRLAGRDDLSDEARGRLHARLAFLYKELGRLDEAVESFRAALRFSPFSGDDARLHQDLGFVLFKLGRYEDAVTAFGEALAVAPGARSYLYVGRCQQELGRAGLAIHAYEQAVDHLDGLDEADRLAVLNDLGFLYFDEAEYARAAAVWERSLAMAQSATILLHRGMALRRLGTTAAVEEALRVFVSIPPGSLPGDLEARRLDELAEIEIGRDDPQAASEVLLAALELADDADRHYRLGLAYRLLGRRDDALAQLRLARRLAPEDHRFATALGYALARSEDYEGAVAELGSVVARDADHLALYEDLGYFNMRAFRNREAADWFRRAIDNEPFYPIRSSAEQKELEREIYGWRKEVTKLENRFDLSLHLAVRSGDAPTGLGGGGLTGGVLPSQGGVELSYLPPKIGFRNDRTFQVFGRLLANLEPTTIQPISASYQGGVGVRYKPFKKEIFYVSAERLVKIGESSQDNTLLRGQYMFLRGEGARPHRSAWSSTSIYLDAGYFMDAPVTRAFFAELRQGVTLRLNNSMLLTPHVVAAGRYQTPESHHGSYFEAGAGVALKFLAHSTYHVERSGFEVLVQYRFGEFLDEQRQRTGDTFDGLVTTAVLHF